MTNAPRNSVCKINFEDEVEHRATELRCLVCYEQRDIGDRDRGRERKKRKEKKRKEEKRKEKKRKEN
jgi:hypothetical protein